MKILLLNDTLIGGGKERRIVQLVCSLTKVSGVQVHVAVLDRRASHGFKGEVAEMKELVDYPEIWQSGAHVHLLERRWKKDPRGFLALWNLVRSIRPDILNVWSLMGAFYSIPIAMLARIPMVSSFVADCNGARKWSMWWWIIQAAIRRSLFVTGNSRAGLDAYEIPSRKAVAIYNGFNFSRLDNLTPSEALRKDLGVSTRYMIAMAARFDSYKDYDTYLGAANQVLSKRNDVTFVCLGQGPDLERCRMLVDPVHQARVVFAGFRKDAESVLAASDLTVLCSNDSVHKEGVSNSILESMATATPVIATRAGGSPEIIEDGASGFLIEPSDTTELTDRVMQLLDDENLRQEMGRRSLEIVKSRFSMSAMLNGFLKVYRNATAKRSHRAPPILSVGTDTSNTEEPSSR